MIRRPVLPALALLIVTSAATAQTDAPPDVQGQRVRDEAPEGVKSTDPSPTEFTITKTYQERASEAYTIRKQGPSEYTSLYVSQSLVLSVEQYSQVWSRIAEFAGQNQELVSPRFCAHGSAVEVAWSHGSSNRIVACSGDATEVSRTLTAAWDTLEVKFRGVPNTKKRPTSKEMSEKIQAELERYERREERIGARRESEPLDHCEAGQKLIKECVNFSERSCVEWRSKCLPNSPSSVAPSYTSPLSSSSSSR